MSDIFKHFKGDTYLKLFESINTDTESNEILFTYVNILNPTKLYTKSKRTFEENVDRPEYNYKGPRFKKIE